MSPTYEELQKALSQVLDPELRVPITSLGMVKDLQSDPSGQVHVTITLTIEGCPLKEKIAAQVRQALTRVPGVTGVTVHLTAMSSEQRAALLKRLRRPGQRAAGPQTRVFAIVSGKGGVGKSTVTANLACLFAAEGLTVGLIDADVHGFSIPGLMGLERQGQAPRPTRIDSLIVPPVAHGVKVISTAMFVKDNAPVVWRGPLLHRALEQFLTDTHFGELDVLLLDLPPGTGDMAISVSQLLPQSQSVVVTTPQSAAAKIAERAGAMAAKTGQTVAGVLENMSWLEQGAQRLPLFGAGGGAALAQELSEITGTTVPLLGQIPLDIQLREGGDTGIPLVTNTRDVPAARALAAIATRLLERPIPTAEHP